MRLVTFEKAQFCIPDDKLMPADCDDQQAWFEENCIGHVFEGRAYAFWGNATCEINEHSDLIAVITALHTAEIESHT